MDKSIKQVTIETLFVGILLTFLFLILLFITNPFLKNNHMIQMLLSVFLSGGIFHILCEYTGINIWYSKQYCDIVDYCKKKENSSVD